MNRNYFLSKLAFSLFIAAWKFVSWTASEKTGWGKIKVFLAPHPRRGETERKTIKWKVFSALIFMSENFSWLIYQNKQQLYRQHSKVLFWGKVFHSVNYNYLLSQFRVGVRASQGADMAVGRSRWCGCFLGVQRNFLSTASTSIWNISRISNINGQEIEQQHEHITYEFLKLSNIPILHGLPVLCLSSRTWKTNVGQNEVETINLKL